ncbi:helix-turn-helix transcriptional regulator [Pantoea sp. BS_4]|uniref:AraC family transcriptional regulator n=1 Tax=Pantoea TaxID=53335 RepID=UPI00345BE288
MHRKNQPAVVAPLHYSPADKSKPDLEIFMMSELSARVGSCKLSGSRRYFFYLLLFVTEGCTYQTVDGIPIECLPGTTLLIKPGQIHSFGGTQGWDGWMVLFRPEMLPPGTGAMQDKLTGTGLLLGADDAALFESVFRQMLVDTKKHNEKPHTSALLYHQLASLFIRLGMMADRDDKALEEQTRNRLRFLKFTDMLEEKFSTWHQVSQYADALSCSSRSLSRATASFAGRSAKSYISERVCLEARRLLAHTPASVSNISEKLGFEEPVHFIKFFKKSAGLSPERFRHSVQKKSIPFSHDV